MGVDETTITKKKKKKKKKKQKQKQEDHGVPQRTSVLKGRSRSINTTIFINLENITPNYSYFPHLQF